MHPQHPGMTVVHLASDIVEANFIFLLLAGCARTVAPLAPVPSQPVPKACFKRMFLREDYYDLVSKACTIVILFHRTAVEALQKTTGRMDLEDRKAWLARSASRKAVARD